MIFLVNFPKNLVFVNNSELFEKIFEILVDFWYKKYTQKNAIKLYFVHYDI